MAGVAGMTARCSVRVPVEIKGSWTAANDDVMDEEGKERLAGAGRRIIPAGRSPAKLERV